MQKHHSHSRKRWSLHENRESTLTPSGYDVFKTDKWYAIVSIWNELPKQCKQSVRQEVPWVWSLSNPNINSISWNSRGTRSPGPTYTKFHSSHFWSIYFCALSCSCPHEFWIITLSWSIRTVPHHLEFMEFNFVLWSHEDQYFFVCESASWIFMGGEVLLEIALLLEGYAHILLLFWKLKRTLSPPTPVQHH